MRRMATPGAANRPINVFTGGGAARAVHSRGERLTREASLGRQRPVFLPRMHDPIMLPQLFALLLSGLLLVGLEVFIPRLARRVGRRPPLVLVFVVSAYFGAFLFAVIARSLGWALLQTPGEMAAFAAGVLGCAFAAGWLATHIGSRRLAA